MPSLLTSLAVAGLIAHSAALPTQQTFDLPQRLDPLKREFCLIPRSSFGTDSIDLSAISPFFIPAEQPTPLPAGHSLERVSLLIRHSAILGNDDEYEDTMGPFIEKIKGTDASKLPDNGPWSFLRTYESPIIEETLEKISDRGKNDARVGLIRSRDFGFAGS